MTSFFEDRTFLVTGGGGFLGSHVVEKLRERGAKDIIAPRKREYDLSEEAPVRKLFGDVGHVDVVIHLAALVGGIGFNKRYPGEMLYRNIVVNTLVMEYTRRAQVGKFVGIGSVCSYPKNAPTPFKEGDLWDGYPEETNASYGLAKKMMLVQGQAYREQYGFDAIHLLMTNLYGPGDNFDPEDAQVIPGLIGKFADAHAGAKPRVVAWGTGEVSREFLYVEDAAEGILLATERHCSPEPVNLGSGIEVRIKDLVYEIKDLVGYEGVVEWDTSKPDGQPRRQLDTQRAKREFGFEARTDIKEGLKRTIEWYLLHRHLVKS